MENFPLLDVVVGLSLIYTFLSLFASELTALVVMILQWRIKCFQRTVITLLGESSDLSGNPERFKDTIAGRLFNHPQITTINQFDNWRDRFMVVSKSYPSLFTEALLDVLHNLYQPKYSSTEGRTLDAGSIGSILAIVESAPELSPQLRTNLQRILYRVQHIEATPEQQQFRLKYELNLWFHYAIVDVSKAYQYQFKLLSFLVSLVLVIAFNIDSLYIIRRISENTATRAVILQNVAKIQACKASLSSPICTDRISFLMESTTIPIGWLPSNRQKQFAHLSRLVILRTITGWLLTSLAVAMGSRFWLQCFNRLGVYLGRKRRRC